LTSESTLTDLGRVWAPKGDGANDPDQWARNVAGKLKVPVTTKIGDYKDRVDDLAQAVSHAEGTTKIPFKANPPVSTAPPAPKPSGDIFDQLDAEYLAKGASVRGKDPAVEPVGDTFEPLDPDDEKDLYGIVAPGVFSSPEHAAAYAQKLREEQAQPGGAQTAESGSSSSNTGDIFDQIHAEAQKPLSLETLKTRIANVDRSFAYAKQQESELAEEGNRLNVRNLPGPGGPMVSQEILDEFSKKVEGHQALVETLQKQAGDVDEEIKAYQISQIPAQQSAITAQHPPPGYRPPESAAAIDQFTKQSAQLRQLAQGGSLESRKQRLADADQLEQRAKALASLPPSPAVQQQMWTWEQDLRAHPEKYAFDKDPIDGGDPGLFSRKFAIPIQTFLNEKTAQLIQGLEALPGDPTTTDASMPRTAGKGPNLNIPRSPEKANKLAAKAANDIADGVFGLMTPAIARHMLVSPIDTLIGLGLFKGADAGTKAALEAAGVEPEYRDLLGTAAGILAGFLPFTGMAKEAATKTLRDAFPEFWKNEPTGGGPEPPPPEPGAAPPPPPPGSPGNDPNDPRAWQKEEYKQTGQQGESFGDWWKRTNGGYHDAPPPPPPPGSGSSNGRQGGSTGNGSSNKDTDEWFRKGGPTLASAFKLLGLNTDGSAKWGDVKAAFRQIVRESHPDAVRQKYAEGSPEWDAAMLKMKRANAAWEVLTDHYERAGRTGEKATPPPPRPSAAPPPKAEAPPPKTEAPPKSETPPPPPRYDEAAKKAGGKAASSEPPPPYDAAAGKAGGKPAEKPPETATPSTAQGASTEPPATEAEQPASTPKETGAVHDYSSTQVNLPDHISTPLQEFGKTIPEEQLAKDGRDQEPHVTALYGLHTEDPEDVRKLLADQGPITVKLGKASIFPAAETESSRGGAGASDVLKVDVDSPDLHKINAILAQLPHTNDFPQYHPHVTIAYLQPGQGEQYNGREIPGVTGQEITLKSLTFSGKDGKKTEIALTGKSSAPEEAGAETVEPVSPKGESEPGTSTARTIENPAEKSILDEESSDATRTSRGQRQGEEPPVSESGGSGDRRRYGEGTTIRVPGEARTFDARYAVRELEDVVPSHHPVTLQPNPAYRYRNDRNYADPRNAERIIKQVAEFDPNYVVTESPDAVNGAPVVNRGGHVLGGNSRAMTIERVYRQRPAAAQAYRDLLAKKAAQFGLKPEDIQAMKHPVLVRELTRELTKEEAQSAVTDLNKTGTAALTPSERAVADSNKVSPETLEQLAGMIENQGPEGTLAKALEGKAGVFILDRLVKDGVITTQEKPTLFDGAGNLTQTAKDRIAKLMLGRVFKDSEQYEAAPPALRNKLERIMAPLSRVSGKPEWDIQPEVRQAVDMLEQARATGSKNLDDLVAQQGLFGGVEAFSPRTVAIAKALQSMGPVKLAQTFSRYANDSRGPTMFGEVTQGDAFAEAFDLSAPDQATRSRIFEVYEGQDQRFRADSKLFSKALKEPSLESLADYTTAQQLFADAQAATRRNPRARKALIWVNRPAAEALRQAIGKNAPEFWGKHLDHDEAQMVIDRLRTRARQLGAFPKAAKALHAVADRLRLAVAENGDAVVVVGREMTGGRRLEDVIPTIRHEELHRAQHELPGGIESHIDGLDFAREPVIARGIQALANRPVNVQAGRTSPGALWAEIPAYVAAGQWDRLDYTLEEAAEAYSTYLRYIEQRHGTEAVDSMVEKAHYQIRRAIRGRNGASGEKSPGPISRRQDAGEREAPGPGMEEGRRGSRPPRTGKTPSGNGGNDEVSERPERSGLDLFPEKASRLAFGERDQPLASRRVKPQGQSLFGTSAPPREIARSESDASRQGSLVSSEAEDASRAITKSNEDKLLGAQLTAQIKSGLPAKDFKPKPAQSGNLFEEEGPEQNTLFQRKPFKPVTRGRGKITINEPVELEYTPEQGNRPPILGGNLEGAARLMDVIMNQPEGSNQGLMVYPWNVPSWREEAEKRAVSPRNSPEVKEGFRALAEVFDKAEKAGQGFVFVAFEPGTSTLLHELRHVYQRLVTGGYAVDFVKDPKRLFSHRYGPKVRRRLLRMGYANNPSVLAAELDAHLASGPGGWADLGLTPEQAQEYADFADALAVETYGQDKLDEYEDVLGGSAILGKHDDRDGAVPDGRSGGSSEEESGDRPGSAQRQGIDGQLREGKGPGVPQDAVSVHSGSSGAQRGKLGENRPGETETAISTTVRKDVLASRRPINPNEPESNFSGRAAKKSKFVRNLSQVEKARPQVHEKAVQAATSRAQTTALIHASSPQIVKALRFTTTTRTASGWQTVTSKTPHPNPVSYLDLRRALIESNLRGRRDRWERYAQEAANSSNDDLQGFLAKVMPALKAIHEESIGVPLPSPALTAAALFERGDMEGLREFLADTFERAAGNVATMMPDAQYQAITNQPGFAGGLHAYKALIEPAVRANHQENEGWISDALGPLDTYYPLIRLDLDDQPKPGRSGRATPYRPPLNIANHFSTGHGEAYDPDMEAFQDRIRNAFRVNNKAALIRAITDYGLGRVLGKGEEPREYFTFGGKHYKAVKVEVRADRQVATDKGTVFVGAQYMEIPAWLEEELRPILDRQHLNLSNPTSVLGKITKVTLFGPLDAAVHSANLIGTLVANTPFLGKTLAAKVAGGNPVTKRLAAMFHLLHTDPTSEESAQDIIEMARLGLIPEKYGSVASAWFQKSREFAGQTGAELDRFFGPFLYGPSGIDVRARLVMYRNAKAINPNATPLELYRYVNQLGNYNRALQGEIERLLKESQWSPFYTAGSTMNRNGVNALTGMSPMPKSGKAGRSLRVQAWIKGSVGLLAMWVILHELLRGEAPWDDPHSKFLSIRLDPQARASWLAEQLYGPPSNGDAYVGLAFFSPLVGRGTRALGIAGAYDAHQAGGSSDQILDAALTNVINTAASPVMGPPLKAASIALTGSEPYLTSAFHAQFLPAVAPQKPGVAGWAKAHLVAPLLSMNSSLAQLAAASGQVKGLMPHADDPANHWLRMITDLLAPALFSRPGDTLFHAESLARQRSAAENRESADQERAITNAFRDGDEQRALALAQKAFEAGSLKMADLDRALKNAQVPASVAGFATLSPEASVEVFARMTPKEKTLVGDALLNKLNKAIQEDPPAKRNILLHKMVSAGLLEQSAIQ
jgi:hypothetical protein